ncbi:zinc finger and SCAN domain-containing protein 31-like [Erythrolamprus reginae]|uniref:zinc finger and SCAN domain-containing protein 31-like n=1 Tax=Erythrolamprus reginae TaxID=121349 RepID=UPI00396C33E6
MEGASLSLEIHRRRFRGLDGCRQEAEKPRELCSRLHRLCRQWLRPERSSKGEMLDRVVLEQLLALLPPEMAGWVRECGAESCSQAVALAEGFLLSRAQRKEPQEGQVQEPFMREIPAELQQRAEPSSPSQELFYRRIQLGPPCQGSGSFEEETVDFTLEEWELLDSDQKTLCSDVTWGVLKNIGDDGLETKNSKQARLKTETCEVEEVIFGNIKKGNLNHHKRIHTGERLHKCMECGKSFTQKWYLTSHNKIHTGERPYKCLECGKSFATKGQLNCHERIHTGEKPYKCLQCGKTFSHKRNLNDHKRIHTGERPYTCMDCGKSFTTKGQLNRHERIHTGEKPYKCLQCGKTFSQKGHLNVHKRIHTGERPHKCKEFENSLITNAHLIYHQTSHTVEKQCLKCEKTFSRKGTLNVHKRIDTG